MAAKVEKASLLEMVFERREKKYGAYELRKKYPRRLMIAAFGVLFVFVMATLAPTIAKMLTPENAEDDAEKVVPTVLSLDELPPPPPMDENEPPPPPPVEDIPPPQRSTVEFKVPEPTPEEELPPEEEEETIATQEDLEQSTPGLETQEGTDDGALIGDIEGEGEVPQVVVEKPKPKKEEEPDINAMIFVQKEPAPVNMNDIRKAIGYPQIARDAGIEGMVVVRILVDKNGNYKKHKIIKQAHPMLAKSCEKHVGKLKFTPAIQGGKPIQFWVNVPFRFKLEK